MGPFLQRRLSLAGQLGVCMGLLTPVPIYSRPPVPFSLGHSMEDARGPGDENDTNTA